MHYNILLYLKQCDGIIQEINILQIFVRFVLKIIFSKIL